VTVAEHPVDTPMIADPRLAAYHKTSVRSASPSQLLLALYDAAIAALTRAADADAARDLETRGLELDKAQAIIGELIASLNTSVPSPLPDLLARVYCYMSRQLADACLHGGAPPLLKVRHLLSELRSAWAQAQMPQR
jgi:flagellar protein FliS